MRRGPRCDPGHTAPGAAADVREREKAPGAGLLTKPTPGVMG